MRRQLRHAFLGLFAFIGVAAAQEPRIATPRLFIAKPAEQPVRLASVAITADIVGGQAQTFIQMVFRNPNQRVLEGELQFPLLEGQQVAGFALDVDGQMRDAVPVEKAKGRQVFEDIARRGVDPGLLEATQGNNYKLRVYPLPAQGTRTVKLRIVEALEPRAGGRVYRLPTSYGTVPNFSVVVREDGKPVAQLDGPPASGVLEVPVRQAAASAWAGELDGTRYFYAELPVRAGVSRRTPPENVTLAWDSSGSGAKRDHGREFALLDAYFQRMGDGLVRLLRVRDAVSQPEEFRVTRGDWRALRRALERTEYDGATNLGALAPLAGAQETLLFTDGLANFGDAAAPRLAGRVYAISAAASGNAALLRQVAESTGGRYIDLLALERKQAAELLLTDAPRLLHADAEGARDVIAASPFPRAGLLAFAGVLERGKAELEVAIEMPGGNVRRHRIPVRATAGGELPGLLWARLRVDALEGEYALHRAEIRRLGKAFGLVTRETSLIVLERIEDYAQNEILPPAGLRGTYERILAAMAKRRAAERQSQLERVVRLFQEKQAWWNRAFPKDAPAVKQEEPGAAGAETRAAGQVAREDIASRRAPAAAPAAAMALAKSRAERDAGASGIAIRLQRWTPDAPYLRRLRDADVDASALYRVYLDERADNAASTAFFLDAADLFFERGERALAVRILSNLAELDLENRHVLRILGYRLVQANEAALAVPVLQRVRDLSPDEPQSWRDLGLAYAATGATQKAVDALYEVVVRPWHGRFPEVELITLAELNSIVARAAASSGPKPDTSRIDPRLLVNLPLDLRVVLSWDADNTDIDLWVTDPNGEKAYYGNRMTFQGGRMSLDFTGGYGPEEFSLRSAKPGKYKVEAQFFGNRQQIVAGATTLSLRLATRFGTPDEAEKIVTLRLKDRSERVLVGEFEVK